MSVDIEMKGCKHCNGRSIHFSYENKWYCPVGIIPEFAALQTRVAELEAEIEGLKRIQREKYQSN